MSTIAKAGSRVALSFVLACGLSPQIAFADTDDEQSVGQMQIIEQDPEGADSAQNASSQEGQVEDEQVAPDSESTEDVEEVAQLDGSSSDAEKSSTDTAQIDTDESEDTTDPSEQIMQQSLDALDNYVNANAGISLLSLDESASARSTSQREMGIVEEYNGADRIEVACRVAEAAYPDGASTAIIAGSEGWADALSATSLAGALDCPILLTDRGSLNSGTKETLTKLGVKSAIIVGGPNTVSTAVESQLKSAGVSVEKRLGGADRYEVQMNIYNYAKDKWDTSLVLIASGDKFSDALSSSPLAFSKKAPIFLADGSGSLNSAQKSAIGAIADNGGAKQCVIVGGPASVSSTTESFLDGVALVATDGKSESIRLGGADRYEASANFAKWAVGQGYLKWDSSAFTTGERPYDALTGSVLQGKDGAAMLLIGGTGSATVSAFISGNPGAVKFFGGTASVPSSWRSYIMDQMNLVESYDTGVTLDAMAIAQTKVSSASKQDLLNALNPGSYAYSSPGFYQFADVSHYSGKVSAAQVDSFIKSVCDANGYSYSTLLGKGQAIVAAAKSHDVNEVYLMAHAILESGWGTSALAQGKVSGYEGYYNFFGIGAYDIDPNNMGAAKAKAEGWNTPEKALDGAAAWISKYYTDAGQNTLYKMRWNLQNGQASHQYASSLTWASSIARVMNQAYEYFGLEMNETGLVFLYPSYR